MVTCLIQISKRDLNWLNQNKNKNRNKTCLKLVPHVWRTPDTLRLNDNNIRSDGSFLERVDVGNPNSHHSGIPKPAKHRPCQRNNQLNDIHLSIILKKNIRGKGDKKS